MESKVDVDLSKSYEEDEHKEFVVSLVTVTVKKTSTLSSGFSRSQQAVDISSDIFLWEISSLSVLLSFQCQHVIFSKLLSAALVGGWMKLKKMLLVTQSNF